MYNSSSQLTTTAVELQSKRLTTGSYFPADKIKNFSHHAHICRTTIYNKCVNSITTNNLEKYQQIEKNTIVNHIIFA